MDEIQFIDEPLQPSLASIYRLQAEIAKMPQADVPLYHHFSKGVYARELMLPAGTAAVGKMHGTEHLIIIACGDVTIMTDDGMRRLQGPLVLNSKPGVKRAAYAHADTTIITIHVTDETDLDKIEAQVIVPETPEMIEGELACLGSPQ